MCFMPGDLFRDCFYKEITVSLGSGYRFDKG